MGLQDRFKDPPVQYRMLQIIHPFPETFKETPLAQFLQDVGEDAAQSNWVHQVVSNVSSSLDQPANQEQTPTRNLAVFLKKYGYGGVVANVSFQNYLEDENAWKTFLQGVHDCRELGMRVWLYDEKGYPSGKAGGITMRNHPEYECEGVVCAQVSGKGELRLKIPTGERVTQPALQVLALPLKDNRPDLERLVSLTTTAQVAEPPHPQPPPPLGEGRASPPPAGEGQGGGRAAGGGEVVNGEISFHPIDESEWMLMAFHRRRMYEGTHIVTNLSDRLPYINIMDREAVAEFLNNTHQAYRNHCDDSLWAHIEAIFTDEPSLMTSYLQDEEGLLPAVPWSRTFAAEFEKRKGYSILEHLPELFVDCGEAAQYVRMDYWKVVAELIEENFYHQIQEWCQANKIASSGHTLLEEGLYHHAVFEGDLYRDLRRMDIPGIDILSSYPHELARGIHIQVPKFVSSVTHLSGLKNCQSETSSHVQNTGNVPCSFQQKLGTINWMYVLGLTTVTSYYAPGQFNNEERRTFNDHIGRLGAMLTEGQHIAAVAVYYPIWSQWAGLQPTAKVAWQAPQSELSERINRVFAYTSRDLLAAQLDYDFVDDQALTEAAIDQGTLKIHNEQFRVVVLPETYAIPLSVYQKLADFVAAGGFLVSIGNLPAIGIDSNETKKVLQLTQKLSQSDHVKVVTQIEGLPGAVKAFIPADVSLNEPCGDLFYLHQKHPSHDLYFLANNGDQKVSRTVQLNCLGKTECWHPTTGEIKPLESKVAAQQTIVELTFEPYEGYFVLFLH